MSLVAVGACYVDTILAFVPSDVDTVTTLTQPELPITPERMRSSVQLAYPIAAEATAPTPSKCCSS